MIEDLDGVIEPARTWQARWLLPAAGAMLLGAVLASSFLRFTPARPTVLGSAPPAIGIKSIELPRNVATLQTRLQFSGVTGLVSMEMSDGFRDTYRLADGRLVIVIEYPDPANGALLAPPQRAAVRLRGGQGAVFDTLQASQPKAIAWVADGMQYQLGGAFSTDELISLAEQLR
jgi:hypothetical protein